MRNITTSRLIVIFFTLLVTNAYAVDNVAEKIVFSALELKVKYYNGVNLYGLCSEYDVKYKSLAGDSYLHWHEKNHPLFAKVLTIMPEKDDYFNNPLNHKKSLIEQFGKMSGDKKHATCENLIAAYESTAMDFSKSHAIVFTYIAAKEHKNNENTKP